MFGFAQPNQIIRAVKTYCCSMHNCMTWSLYSNMANQFYNCWFTCVKLAWNVDRATKTYFVDNLLAGGLPSLRLASFMAVSFTVQHLRSSVLLVLLLLI